MPSGRTHDRITLWSLPVVAVGAAIATRQGDLALWTAGGFLAGGLMLGPDLDIYSRQFKRWGWLRWMWIPYQKSLRHRSFWSHGPVVGTAIRLGYLAAIATMLGLVGVALLASGYELLGQGDRWPGVEAQLWARVGRAGQWLTTTGAATVAAAIVGLELGAMSHSLSDWIGSALKRHTKASRPAQNSRPPRLGRSVGRATGRSVGRATGQSLEQVSEQASGQSSGQSSARSPRGGKGTSRRSPRRSASKSPRQR